MNGLGFNIRAAAGTIVLEVYGVLQYWDNLHGYLRWQIEELGADAPIIVRCDSVGGDPRAAMAVAGIIQAHAGKSTCYIEYMCASSATVIASVCDEVIGNEFPFEYMIHEPKINQEWVTADEAISGASQVRKSLDDFVKIYADRSGQSEDDIRAWMKAEKFMNAQQALELGFIDRIEQIPATLSEKVDYELAAKAYNRPEEFKITGRGTSPTTKQPTLKANTMKTWEKIKAMVGLGDSADETDTAIKVKEIKAQADRVPGLEQEVQQLKQDKIELQAKLDTYEEAEPTEEVKQAQVAQEIDAELQAAVGDFKIQASAVDNYKKTFEGNPEGLKAALELIPKDAVKPGGKVRASSPSKVSGSVPERTSQYFD